MKSKFVVGLNFHLVVSQEVYISCLFHSFMYLDLEKSNFVFSSKFSCSWTPRSLDLLFVVWKISLPLQSDESLAARRVNL